jgi:hypothetical protein
VRPGKAELIALLPKQLNITAVARLSATDQRKAKHDSEDPDADDGAQSSPHAPTLSSLGWDLNDDSSMHSAANARSTPLVFQRRV